MTHTNSLKEIKNQLEKLKSRLRSKPVLLVDVYTGKEISIPLADTISVEVFDTDLIITVPHAGTLMPKSMMKDLDDVDLLIEIDMHSDKIYNIKRGIHISSALAPFIIDMNRSKGGSNSAPSHLTNDPLNYMTINDKPLRIRKMDKNTKRDMIRYYDLFHEMISTAVQIMKSIQCRSLVIDGHSMTSKGLRKTVDKNEKRPDFLLGTLGYTSAHTEIIDAFKEEFEKMAPTHGWTVGVDNPYSGGFITKMHSTETDIIQLEVSMRTYMHEGFMPGDKYTLKPELKNVKKVVDSAITAAIKASRNIPKDQNYR